MVNETFPKYCDACGAEAKKSCSKCKEAFYCSVDCQRNAWSAHKKICGGGYVLVVKNRHPTQSPRSSEPQGPPPNLDGSLDFQAYFENAHGEQTVVLWDFRKMEYPVVIDGDWSWLKPIVLKGTESFVEPAFLKMGQNDGTALFGGSHLIGWQEQRMLEMLYAIGKEKYDLWLEAGGITDTSSDTPDVIPYDKGSTKGRVITIPNKMDSSSGLPPCFNAPKGLPKGDEWERVPAENGKYHLIIKSPIYGHFTLYFDSTRGQLLFEWDISNSETARVWASHLGWDTPIDIGPEHLQEDGLSDGERKQCFETTKEFLESKGLDDSEAMMINLAYYIWNKGRNNMLKGDQLYYDKIEQRKGGN